MAELIYLGICAILAIAGVLAAMFALWLALTIAYGIIMAFFATLIAASEAFVWLLNLPVRFARYCYKRVTHARRS